MRRLTYKQKAFINEFVKCKNGSEAAMKVYDVKNKNVARNIASTNLIKPNIRKSIDEHLRSSGYQPSVSISRLMLTEEKGAGIKATASDSIRASELLLKLSGNLIERKQSTSVNVNVDNLDKNELLKLKDKYDKLLNDS
jgi:hypothetical protein